MRLTLLRECQSLNLNFLLFKSQSLPLKLQLLLLKVRCLLLRFPLFAVFSVCWTLVGFG